MPEMLKLETKYFKVELANGYFLSFVDTVTGKNYLPSSEKAPVMKIRVVSGPFVPNSEKKTYSPSGMAWKKNGDTVLLELEYAELGGVKAEISVQVKPAYLVFELKSISS